MNEEYEFNLDLSLPTEELMQTLIDIEDDELFAGVYGQAYKLYAAATEAERFRNGKKTGH